MSAYPNGDGTFTTCRKVWLQECTACGDSDHEDDGVQAHIWARAHARMHRKEAKEEAREAACRARAVEKGGKA